MEHISRFERQNHEPYFRHLKLVSQSWKNYLFTNGCAFQVVVPVGEPVTVDCVVSGMPRPVVLWMQERDRTVLLPGDRIAETGLGVTEKGSLKIANAQISSSYVCLASNLVGSAMARTDVIVVASKADAEQVNTSDIFCQRQLFP